MASWGGFEMEGQMSKMGSSDTGAKAFNRFAFGYGFLSALQPNLLFEFIF
jgi:hypothetical protein